MPGIGLSIFSIIDGHVIACEKTDIGAFKASLVDFPRENVRFIIIMIFFIPQYIGKTADRVIYAKELQGLHISEMKIWYEEMFHITLILLCRTF